jgi:Tfp pilus assembly protein PilO
MRDAASKKSLVNSIQDQLRHPLKLRVMLSVAMLAGWYYLFFSPLSEQMVLTETLIKKERQRIGTAHQIDKIRKSLQAFKDRVPSKSDPNELMRYVMNRIRSSPLKLIDLRPDKSKGLGPYNAMGLRLTLEGTYSEIDELLSWIHNEQRLLRVETISLAPAGRGSGKNATMGSSRLNIQLALTNLMEKESA